MEFADWVAETWSGAARRAGSAQIADICRWYAVGGPLTAQRQAAALAEIANITGGRNDLLARYAGQSLAGHDTEPGDIMH